MTEEEITALTREYAEEENPISDYNEHNMFYRNIALGADMEKAESIITWLLRRFCLVEKEAVRKEYESVKDTSDYCNYEEHGATWDETPYLSRFYDEGYDCGQKNLLESLFPEIGKEVEYDTES